MSGRFAKLRPDSDARQAFWNMNLIKIRTSLEEINTDVFDGKGKFEEASFEGHYRTEPQLTEPNLFISFPGYGSLSVCTASESQLRVIVEKWSGSNYWKSWECKPFSLDIVLESYVKYLVG